jgi:hypothetical protein
MENQKEPIATINGVNVYTDVELLKVFCESFPFPEYIDIENIADVSS